MLRKVGIAIGAASVTMLVAVAGWSQSPVGFTPRVLMQATQTSIGQNILYPLFRSQLTTVLVEIAPGGQTGRHMHPVPVAVYVLEGSITVAHEAQEKTYKAGDAFVESVDTWHNGLNRGTTPVKLLLTVVGEQGKPFLVR